MTEHVVTAAECEYSREYHLVPQYGVAEINDKTSEIIGTGFLNVAVPFIRYRTTDVAIGVKYTKCKCDRYYLPSSIILLTKSFMLLALMLMKKKVELIKRYLISQGTWLN